MQEIKFRAWDTKYNVIVPWDDISESRTLAFLVNNHNRKSSKCVLMQYTGLKDKNGADIYEGDIILRFPGGNKKGIVDYKYASFWFNFGKQSFILDNHDCDFKVIGNIYENKELLEI